MLRKLSSITKWSGRGFGNVRDDAYCDVLFWNWRGDVRYLPGAGRDCAGVGMDTRIDATWFCTRWIRKHESYNSWRERMAVLALVRPVEPLDNEAEYGQSLVDWFDSLEVKSE